MADRRKTNPGRPRTSTSSSETDRVLNEVINEPRNSVAKVARELQKSKSSVLRILKRQKFKPYRAVNAQALTPSDSMRRLRFCHWFNSSAINENLIWFSDEKFFRLNGELNTNNVRTIKRPQDFLLNAIRAHSTLVMV